MSKKNKYILLLLVAAVGAVLAAAWFFNSHPVAVLQPSGSVAQKERNLMLAALSLAVLVVVPVYIMTIVISLKYREGNTKARYSPDWDHHSLIELTWWAIPGAIITVLSIIAWNSAHSLDPFKPLTGKQALTIQVVSLDWKWLFIYPKQRVASVNYFEIPQKTPVDFEVTSDSVMNSFWIPSLGSQIYSMTGMETHVNLMANKPGRFSGSSANISGVGFAGMAFTAQAVTGGQFNNWISQLQKEPKKLTADTYSRLAKPSQNNQVSFYSGVQARLFSDIILKYLPPSQGLQAHIHGSAGVE